MQKILNVFCALALLISIPIWLSRREGRPRIDPPFVLAQVQRLNELTTVKYTLQKVIGLTEQKKPVGSESILLITSKKRACRRESISPACARMTS